MQSPAIYSPQPEINSLRIIGAPHRFPIRRVYCVGRNYVEHIREMKEGDERDPPFFFQKPADAIVSSGSDIPYPLHTSDFQHEVELVVAIGDVRSNGSERPLDCVFGYAIGIDLTRRDRQREARASGLPWEVGKSFDDSAPCSALYRAGDIGHPTSGFIGLYVNGELRQKGDLSEMIWKVPEILVNLSAQYQLKPGDLIFTGTPAGVSALKPGDTVRAEISGVGSIDISIAKRMP